MIYAWIKEHTDQFPIVAMTRVLGVCRSGYYSWRNRKPSKQSIRREKIARDVREIHAKSREIYGSTKVSRELRNCPERESACRATVYNVMKDLDLKSRVARKFKPTTTVSDPSKKPAPNLLNQEFTADRPDQKWVSDITYLKTEQGWVYLAVVLDLFSRKVVGWEISKNLDTGLIMRALNKAIKSREPARYQLIHHSDRGCQYTSDRFRKRLKNLGITCSMSRVGCCYDNAVMERFFWSLKKEWTNHCSFQDMADVRGNVFWYIEAFYNTERIHQTLDYRTPAEVEAQYHLAAAI